MAKGMSIARGPLDGGYPMIGLLSSFNALALTTDSSDLMRRVSLSSSHRLRAGTDNYLWTQNDRRGPPRDNDTRYETAGRVRLVLR